MNCHGCIGNQDSSQGGLWLSSSELDYAVPLIVPGDFIANNASRFQLQRLRDRYAHLPGSYLSTCHSIGIYSSQPPVCQVSIHSSYRPLYTSAGTLQRSLKVIASGSKIFKMDIGVKLEIITVDRLKLAHLDLDSPVQVAQPRSWWRPPGKGSHIPNSPFQVPQPLGTPLPCRTRVGHQIHLPCRYL